MSEIHSKHLPVPGNLPPEWNELTWYWFREAQDTQAQVNTLTNERDLAIRANEQNLKIIGKLRRQLRKEAERKMYETARPNPIDFGS